MSAPDSGTATPDPDRDDPDRDDPDRGRAVVVVPYDPAWPSQFDAARRTILAALGAEAVSVEHVGSTAVPGLAAKPVIDIHLSVRDPADETLYRPALEAAGFAFVHRAPDWFEHRLFKGREPAEINLHLFPVGCPELDRCCLFRDWLRVDGADRALYADTKRTLATRRWDHVQDYADAKTEVILQILSRAEAWSGGAKG